MKEVICRQCKKTFEPQRHMERLCSDVCRMAAKRGYKIKADALRYKNQQIARAQRESLIAAAIPDVLKLRVGQRVLIAPGEGEIIGIIEPGDSVLKAWERLLDERPEFYSANAGIATTTPVSSRRYIIAIEKNGLTYIKWPYVQTIKGVIDGGKESKGSEESKKSGSESS